MSQYFLGTAKSADTSFLWFARASYHYFQWHMPPKALCSLSFMPRGAKFHPPFRDCGICNSHFRDSKISSISLFPSKALNFIPLETQKMKDTGCWSGAETSGSGHTVLSNLTYPYLAYPNLTYADICPSLGRQPSTLSPHDSRILCLAGEGTMEGFHAPPPVCAYLQQFITIRL